MARRDDAWLEHQRRRWLRPDWQRWLRPDWQRLALPGGGLDLPPEAFLEMHLGRPLADARKDRAPNAEANSSAADVEAERRSILAELSELRRLRADLKRELALKRLALKAGYDPDQPRILAGNFGAGRWTDDGGGGGRVRLAAGDKPVLGRASVAAVLLEAAKRAIEAYRSDNFLRDFFGKRVGTVSMTAFKGETIFGSNSTSPTYTDADYAAAERMRAALLEKYPDPDVLDLKSIGRRPNDALFHAEATVLFRAAARNGGTLAGQELEVFTDRPMCRSCDTVLPYIVQELGNPMVTFVSPKGSRKVLRNGVWTK